MFCSKCGNELESHAQFCSRCGADINSCHITFNNTKKKSSKRKTTIIICIIIVVSLIFTSITLTIGVKKLFSHINKTEKNNSALQANFSNWGLTCAIENNIYFSDMETVIGIKEEREPFAHGVFHDLCNFFGKLACVEIIQNIDKPNQEQIVFFDVITKEKNIVFTIDSPELYISFLNIINDELYFTLSESDLYKINLEGEVVDTGIRNVSQVTPEGVYTSKYDKYGLRLVDFNNKEIVNYPNLKDYMVYAYFEINGFLYAAICDENDEYQTFIILDIETGQYKKINNQTKFGELIKINFIDNRLFCSFGEYNPSDCSAQFLIYESSLDGSNMTRIAAYQVDEENYNPFCPITIVEDYIYVLLNYQYKPEFININN